MPAWDINDGHNCSNHPFRWLPPSTHLSLGLDGPRVRQTYYGSVDKKEPFSAMSSAFLPSIRLSLGIATVV